LTQLYGLKYGTLPVVRRVGGLADTVVDTQLDSIDTVATGFVFDDFSAAGLLAATARATALHRRPADWATVRSRAMQQTFGWADAARQYESLYQQVST
jgi:starch synthase